VILPPYATLDKLLLLMVNAPVQVRWANAQRADLPPPNPPTVACNRLILIKAPS
jgi:hypothetical protein